ncbi:hypothetical protein ABZY58_12015 [Micromonospora tulbaghiae]|uniref:hypothetical protein n=1 Tax=Micromonospora tulbaghiae TaxID=479978 RepID=UPI0033AED0A4
MARGGSYPRITCPGCGRPGVPVAPSAETVVPHDEPNTSARCATSGQQVDLYGPELAGGQS